MNKKIIGILAAIFIVQLVLLSGCGAKTQKPVTEQVDITQPTPEAVESTEQPAESMVAVELYLPNSNADGFELTQAQIPQLGAEELLGALIDKGVFPAAAAVNAFELSEGAINIDMNQAFMKAFLGTGTAGEYMLMGSFVNTFLAAFDAQSLSLTIDGEYLETGHSIYDFSMGHMD